MIYKKRYTLIGETLSNENDDYFARRKFCTLKGFTLQKISPDVFSQSKVSTSLKEHHWYFSRLYCEKDYSILHESMM